MSRYRPPPPPKSNYITGEGAQRLHAEVETLWRERAQVTQEGADAAAQGDRSENAEYIYGKKRLREIDGRLGYLSRRLKVVKIVTESPPEDGKVYFGCWVRIADEDGKERQLRIVGPDEFDVSPSFVSMDAPMGKALLGKVEGDEVTVRLPGGDTSFEILAVRARPFPS